MSSGLARDLPLYLGGFMGPFGTMVIIPMFPELRQEFDASSSAVGWGFTAYMFPMAALLLVSGTIGERYGRQGVLRASFALYTAASLATAFAPTLTLFLVGRALQGTCNAFFTPLLLAGLAAGARPELIGQKVGIYSGFQALGSAAAPLAGGVAGDTQWRFAFVATAIVSCGLMLSVRSGADQSATAGDENLPNPAPRPDPAPRPSLRSLWRRNVLFIGLAALFSAAGPLTGTILVGLKARDELGLDATAAGAIVFGGSLAGVLLAPVWGMIIGNVGGRRLGCAATVATCASLVVVGFMPNAISLLVAWTITGAFVVGIVVALQGLAAIAVPENRGGALSATMSFRFVGHGLGPILWVPIFLPGAPARAFVGAAMLGVLSSAAFWQATRPSVAAT